jgi:hypothetical protein
VTGRLVSLGIALTLLVALSGAIVAACYDVPRPACGFLCGPDGACPDGYACASDQVCHVAGSPDSLVCPHPDAALPADAAPDAPPDAPPDAAEDAAPDMALDAPLDMPPDMAPP